MAKTKFTLDTDVKSAILKKIASEVAHSSTSRGLNSYYKSSGGGGGGIYGKGSFGKSEPPQMLAVSIDLSTKRSIATGVAKATKLMKKKKKDTKKKKASG
jgi:hypothetical protein